MSQNPYLINTGGLFGLTWGNPLKDSYAFSQIIYITNLLIPLDSKKIEDFKQEDFRVYANCKKLAQNLKSLMQNKLDAIAGYQTLIIYYKDVSKKIKDEVSLKKTKYDKAIVNFNSFVTDTTRYQKGNAAFELMTIKKHILDYSELLLCLGMYDEKSPLLNLLPKIKEQQELNENFFESQEKNGTKR